MKFSENCWSQQVPMFSNWPSYEQERNADPQSDHRGEAHQRLWCRPSERPQRRGPPKTVMQNLRATTEERPTKDSEMNRSYVKWLLSEWIKKVYICANATSSNLCTLSLCTPKTLFLADNAISNYPLTYVILCNKWVVSQSKTCTHKVRESAFTVATGYGHDHWPQEVLCKKQIMVYKAL